MSSPQKHRAICLSFCAASLICATATASAQQVLVASAEQAAPTSSTALTTAATSLPMPDETFLSNNVENADAAAPLPAETEPNVSPTVATPVESGFSSVPRRFHYSFDVTVQAIYDDNVNVQPINQLSDLYFSIDPRLVLGFGDIVARTETFLRLEYTPSLEIYTTHSDLNAFQQVARLEGQHQISRLTLTLAAQLERLDSTYITVFNGGTPADQVNVDVSTRTRVDLYGASLGASYDLSSKTFVSGSGSFSASEYNNLISSQSLAGNAFLNYRYSPKLTFGVGGGLGHNTIDDPDPDETFEQATARLVYQATGKLSFTGTGGVEFRQIDSGTENDSASFTTPVFDLSTVFQPFDGTKLTLTASRRTLNSAVLAGQDYNATSLALDVRQRLLRRITLGVTFSYQNLDYFATTATTAISRQDDYYSIQPSIDVAVTRFWTVGAFYNRRQNSSSLENFGFDNNQVGFRTSLSF